MRRRGAWTLRSAACGLLAAGCAWNSPVGAGRYIEAPITPPAPPPADPAAAKLPDPPAPAPTPPPKTAFVPRPDPASPLGLPEVLARADAGFPLLFALQQEVPIAGGQRLAAEGAYDLVARSRFLSNNGSYDYRQFDLGVEQLTLGGTRLAAGYRRGIGDFPVYYGDRQTADGGELRVGATVPLWRDRAIDPARARLRAAEIAEQLADPTVRRGRIDVFRDAAVAYWTWVAAGAQFQVAEELLKLSADRQAQLDEQLRLNLLTADVVVLNRRLVAERQRLLAGAKQQLEQAAVVLSRYTRDAKGDPEVPSADRLPFRFIDLQPPPPTSAAVPTDVAAALDRRPELVRFRLLREQAAVDLKLALNAAEPALNLIAGVAQDMGPVGKPGLDRSTAQVGVGGDLPLQRRDPAGRARTAQARMIQAAAQERDARDQIGVQVAAAAAALDGSYKQLGFARTELAEAITVRQALEERVLRQAINLVELNIQEQQAAGAQANVVTALLAYLRAVAEYRAALGQDGPGPLPGAVLP